MKINSISPLNNAFTQIISGIALKHKKLFYSGSLPSERFPTIAIVGTRRPTSYGKEVTINFATDLSRKGFVIVSGLALGIDGIAHKAALEAGGRTIAVLGNGLGDIYPKSHSQLAQQIIQSGGALISEYEPHIAARGYQFLERNRIVSGLSDAVLITEASARSGTINTAHHALNQGKEVFVVPGNITSPLSAGCNLLIKQGATPVTSPDDIIEILAPHLLTSQASLALGDNPLQTKILTLLQSGIRDGDELYAQCGTRADEFSQELTMLEINGYVRALGANQWTTK